MDQGSIGGDKIGGDKAGRDVIKDVAISAVTDSAISLTGDAVVGTQIKDVAGNVIIHQHILGQDAARYQHIRQYLLDQLQAIWIKSILENSLYEVARLELGLESLPDAVERPWAMNLERPNQPPQTLPPTSKILDTYRELGGAMLILGEPGSGKTITLLELARELRTVALADPQQPIPLYFNLSTFPQELRSNYEAWTKGRWSFLDWLTSQLHQVYGVGRKQAPGWLKTMPIHLLLDGLDEVTPEHRSDCVTAINNYREDYGPVNVVVCSRTADYNQLITPLTLNGAVVIQPLTPTQITRYLTTATPHLNQLVANDPALQELAQTPLTLNIIALAYRDNSPDELAAGAIENRRQHLFTTYINRMFERRGAAPKVDRLRAIHHLSWLAARMNDYGQSVYYIQETQPYWLGRHRQHYALINMIIFGLLGGLIGGLIGGLEIGLVLGLSASMLGRNRFNYINLTSTIVLSWKEGLVAGLTFGLIGGLIFGLSGALSIGLGAGLSLGLSVGLIFGLIFGLDIFNLTTPGVWSWKDGLKVMLRGGLSVGIIGGLIGLLLGELPGGLLFGLFFGLYASRGLIKHLILRLMLARNGYLPFKIVPFLNEMADRIILRKVGGGYIFIHRMLLEYFADLEKDSQ